MYRFILKLLFVIYPLFSIHCITEGSEEVNVRGSRTGSVIIYDDDSTSLRCHERISKVIASKIGLQGKFYFML